MAGWRYIRNAVLALASGLVCIVNPAFSETTLPAGSWAVYYEDDAPLEDFDSFNLLILDSDYHPALVPLSDRGKVLLGYLSIGEVAQHRDYFGDLETEGLLLEENEIWTGSFRIDVRDERWVRRVIEQLIPSILRRGFDGVFLDTIDNPIYLEAREPERFQGMRDATIRLVKSIRRHYPHIKIVVNRGFEILPDLAHEIDGVLGESVFSSYDFETMEYHLVSEDDYRWQVDHLSSAARLNPDLSIMTLDYWNPSDPEGVRRIYAEQRANGFSPYVSTIELNRVTPELVP